MMPDWGSFTIAWTSYGIVIPLVEHVFGIEPDATRKTVTFDPHLPDGWTFVLADRRPGVTYYLNGRRVVVP